MDNGCTNGSGPRLRGPSAAAGLVRRAGVEPSVLVRVTVSPGAAKKQTSGRSSTYEGGVDHPSGPLGRLRPVSGCPGWADIAERAVPGKGWGATAA